MPKSWHHWIVTLQCLREEHPRPHTSHIEAPGTVLLADCTAGNCASAASSHKTKDHCKCPHMLLCRKLWQQVTQVNRGQRLGDANSMPLSDCTVEDLLRIVRALPAEESAVKAVSQGLQYLDSRAVAALLKVRVCPLAFGSSQKCWPCQALEVARTRYLRPVSAASLHWRCFCIMSDTGE